MTRAFFLLSLAGFLLNAKADTTYYTGFKYYDYFFTVTGEDYGFFTGKLKAVKDGRVIFTMDSSFSRYEWHAVTGLDNDGSNELLLSLTDGASPYLYNVLYIFDVKKGAKPVYMIPNGSLDTTKKDKPKIAGYTRMSPSVTGLSYNWLMEYRYGKLRLLKDPERPWKNIVMPDTDTWIENLTQYEDFPEKCGDGVYNTFFETMYIQYTIAGEEEQAEKLFKKYYKCPRKEKALEQVQNAAADTYSWLNDASNFEYAEE